MLPVLVTLTVLFAATPANAVKSTRKVGAAAKLGPAAGFERPDAKELLREAKELWHIKADYNAAFAITREAVKTALKTAREPEAATSKGLGPFWSMMARAEDTGFLDEAIFIHMLDAALAPEYPAFRETNPERLASYLETLIVE
jgi:hypothetical protein